MTEEQAKRKLAAIFSADVKGYSRLMADDEEATVRTITAYREVMTNLIREHRGRVADAKGDNVLAEFSSVVDAVRCSVEVQKELKKRNSELPEHRRMEFRIGINLGDVIEEEGTIYGDGVNVAARLEGLAEGGGVCISGTAFDQVKNKIPVGYEYRGKQSVKNIPDPVRVYGMLLEPEAAGKVIGEGEPRSTRKRWAVLAALVVLMVVAGVVIWNSYFRPPPIEHASKEKMAFPLPDVPSIAVMPFVNMSEDKSQEFFCDGMTEGIITVLSKVPRLFVVARDSTFTYKGKPVKVKQVSEELGVRYVLEGSFQRSGDRVRITAQLIDALTGNHLWAERYDRDMKDIFALQDEVALRVLTAIRGKLTEGELSLGYGKYYGGKQGLDCYLKIMEGNDLVSRHNTKDNNLARRIGEEALAMCPEVPMAYLLMAYVHSNDYWFGSTSSPRDSVEKAIELVQKAIALDDSLAEAHGFLGYLYTQKREYEKGIAEGERAVALNPGVATVLAYYAMSLNFAGRSEEAIPLFQKAIRLNPFGSFLNSYNALGNALMFTGRHEEAVSAYKEAIQRMPNYVWSHLMLAATYCMMGREKEAQAEAAEVLSINPKFSLEFWAKTALVRDQSIRDKIVNALRKAGLPDNPPLPLPDKPSIAVLPFVNMSEDKSQEFFSDGLTEEIITALSKTPKLFVIARNSSFVYKGKPVNVQRVSRELGVRYVLEGSVRRSGDQLRITAQLIDATTGNHLWAERYDREMKDVFAIQDDVTMKILTSLQVKLTAGEEARMWAKGTKNLEAYLKLLAATEDMFQFNKEHNALAQKLAKEAADLDPQYASAYMILGKTHMMDVFLGTSASPKQSMAQSLQLTQKAIAIDESLGAARGLLGFIYTMSGQFDKGIEEAEKALNLEPNSDIVLHYMGLALRWGGRPNEAIPVIKKAIRLNPFAPSNYVYNLGLSYLFAGQNEDAIAECRKATAAEPHNLGAQLALTVAYGLSGRDEQARATASEVLRIDPKFSLEGFSKTLVYKNQADKDRFVDALSKAGLK